MPAAADPGAFEAGALPQPGTCGWRCSIPWAMGAVVTLKLWLVAAQQRTAVGPIAFDDSLLIKLARHLVRGEWLGPYDSRTLLKGPGYPLWVAANFFLGLPLHVSEHLLYAGACALFVLAIRPLIPSRLVRCGLFVVLLFQPMSFSIATLRHYRDWLYTTQMLGALSCLLGMLLRLAAPLSAIVPWSLGFGCLAGFLWVTREEGVVLLPAVGAAWAMMAWRLWRSRPPDWRRRALVLAVSMPLAATLVLAVALMNLRHYGVCTISEFKRAEFTDAIGALAHVEPAQWRRYVMVPQEVRMRIYPHSAALRDLQWYLDGPSSRLWTSWGKVLGEADQPAMRGEILTGVFAIALREATAVSGHHRSAPEAMRYYRRLAGEINAACAAGQLRCGPPRSSLAPPWRREYLGLTLGLMWRGAVNLATLSDLPADRFHVPVQSVGTEAEFAAIRALTNDRLTPVAGTALPPSQRHALDEWKLAQLGAIHTVYAAALPIVGMLAAASFGLCLWPGRSRGRCHLLGPAVVLLLAIGARLTLLAYMEATSFGWALNSSYMLPLYPLLLAFFLLALVAGLQVLAWLCGQGCRK